MAIKKNKKDPGATKTPSAAAYALHSFYSPAMEQWMRYATPRSS